MAYFRNENNIFCDSVANTAPAGGSVSGIAPSKTISAPIGPRKLDGVSIKFKSSASGTVEVHAVKSGVDLLVRSVELSSAGSLVITDIGLWLIGSDSVQVDNLTGSEADVIVDFVY